MGRDRDKGTLAGQIRGRDSKMRRSYDQSLSAYHWLSLAELSWSSSQHTVKNKRKRSTSTVPVR